MCEYENLLGMCLCMGKVDIYLDNIVHNQWSRFLVFVWIHIVGELCSIDSQGHGWIRFTRLSPLVIVSTIYLCLLCKLDRTSCTMYIGHRQESLLAYLQLVEYHWVYRPLSSIPRSVTVHIISDVTNFLVLSRNKEMSLLKV